MSKKFKIESEYYEKSMTFNNKEAELIVSIYEKVAKKIGFESEVPSSEYLAWGPTFDHAMYYVENFGSKYDGYEKLKHLVKG